LTDEHDRMARPMSQRRTAPSSWALTSNAVSSATSANWRAGASALAAAVKSICAAMT
jgi:hypothetical protein